MIRPLREAVRLIVLDALRSDRETIQMPLGQRRAMGRHLISSATLRAARKAQGPYLPGKLIAWLQAADQHSLANRVREAVSQSL